MNLYLFDTEVEWSCPETNPHGPGEKKIKFRVDLNRGMVASDYKEFLGGLLRDYPSTDYFECAQAFVEKVAAKFSALNPQFAALLKYGLLKQNAWYGQKSYSQNALPPIEPAGRVNRQLPLTQMKENLKSFCGKGMDATFLDRGFLESLTKEMVSPACRIPLTRRFSQLLLDAQPDHQQCEKSEKPCLARRRAVAKTAAILESAGLGPFNSFAASQSMEAFCQNPKDDDFNRRLSLYAQENLSVVNCIVLKENESRDVSLDATSLPAGYMLSRRPDIQAEDGKRVPSYLVTMKLKFVDHEGRDDPVLQKTHSEKARKCYAEIAPWMLGPRGERLEIKLAEDEPTSPDPSVTHPIRIISTPGHRASKNLWSKDDGCAVILHETLHLLGLVDEYREHSNGVIVNEANGDLTFGASFFPERDCAVEGPGDSIMANPYHAFGDTETEITGCACKEKPSPGEQFVPCGAIEKHVRSGKSDCPAGSVKETQSIDGAPDLKFDGSQLATHPTKDYSLVVISGRVRVRPTSPSLLYPAHFRVLTRPGCMAANSLYYQCASQSTITSRGGFGSGKCAVSLPVECKQGGKEWLR